MEWTQGRRAGAVALALFMVGVLLWATTGGDRESAVRQLGASSTVEDVTPTTGAGAAVEDVTTTTAPPSDADEFPAAAEPSTVTTATTVPARTTSTPPATTVTADDEAATPPATTTPTSVPEPSCTTDQTAATTDEMVEAATGAWVLCSAGSPFSTDEAGIEIRPDGRWSKLVRAADGSLQRKHGWEDEGDWTGVQNFQLDMKIDGSGVAIMVVEFNADRSAMTLNNYDQSGRYTAVPASTPIGEGFRRTGDDCTRDEGGERHYDEQGAFEAAVSKVWLDCGDGNVFGDTDGDGVEINPDHTWARLKRENGGLVRMTGVNHSGVWERPDGYSQLWLHATDGSYSIGFQFAAASPKVRMTNYYLRSDVVPAPAGTVIG